MQIPGSESRMLIGCLVTNYKARQIQPAGRRGKLDFPGSLKYIQVKFLACSFIISACYCCNKS